MDHYGRRRDRVAVEQLLLQIRENAIDTLDLGEFDSSNISDLIHALHFNDSIHHIQLGRSSCEERMGPADWVLILGAFQLRHLGQQVITLTVDSTKIPFFVIPTALWQFRNLEKFTITGDDVVQSWDKREWEVLGDALRQHPTLRHSP
jgi:hypothetical protein